MKTANGPPTTGTAFGGRGGAGAATITGSAGASGAGGAGATVLIFLKQSIRGTHQWIEEEGA